MRLSRFFGACIAEQQVGPLEAPAHHADLPVAVVARIDDRLDEAGRDVLLGFEIQVFLSPLRLPISY